MRTVLLITIILLAGCVSDVPNPQNQLTFTLFKRLPNASTDSLQPIYPNPFNRVTGDTALFINFTLHDSGSAIVLIQNAIGDAITEYSDSTLSPGVYQAAWDPLAQDGSRLNSGLYFVTLHTQNYINSLLVNIQENE